MTETTLAGRYNQPQEAAYPDLRSTEMRIARLTQLTLPATALRCIENFCGEDLDASNFCEVVSQDPALTARFIGIANSAFFALPRPVYELETAILNVLGLDFARSLGLSMALSGCFNAQHCEGFDLKHYWATALLQASFVTKLKPKSGADGSDQDALQLAALIRSLGLLVLAHVHPDACSEALLGRERGVGLSPRLRGHCGIDHHQTLRLLLPRWGLAEVLPLVEDSTDELVGSNQRATPGAQALRLAHFAAEACWERAEGWDGHFDHEPHWLTDALRRELSEDAVRRLGVVEELLSVASL